MFFRSELLVKILNWDMHVCLISFPGSRRGVEGSTLLLRQSLGMGLRTI